MLHVKDFQKFFWIKTFEGYLFVMSQGPSQRLLVGTIGFRTPKDLPQPTASEPLRTDSSSVSIARSETTRNGFFVKTFGDLLGMKGKTKKKKQMRAVSLMMWKKVWNVEQM